MSIRASPVIKPGKGATDPAQDPHGHSSLERPVPLGVLSIIRQDDAAGRA